MMTRMNTPHGTQRMVYTADDERIAVIHSDGTVVDGDRTYSFDAAGMMTRMNTPHGTRRMVYTADDERIAVIHSDGTVVDDRVEIRVRDFHGKVLREWNKSITGVEWVRDYIYAEGRLVGGERQVATGDNGVCHYHLDHLGSVRRVSRGGDGASITNVDYSPFGAERLSSATEYTKFGYKPLDSAKFTGHERDYIGPLNAESVESVDYMHARYYNAGLGRFLSVDPINSATPNKPQS